MSGSRKGKLILWFSALNRAKKITLILLVVLLLTAGGASAWLIRINDTKSLLIDVAWNKNGDVDPGIKDVRDAFDNRTLNILLMGFDREEERDARYEVYRPDTIMLAAFDLDTGKTDVISIPRDTLVPIYNCGGSRDKINSAYTYGWYYGDADPEDLEERHRLGMKYQLETVSLALKGIPVHYYIAVDMDAVVEIVDVMGGVWYDVENPVYHKTSGKVLDAGYQLLDGEKFLSYVRNRSYTDGDIQRVKNQQNILLAAFDQFKHAQMLIYLPQVYSSFRQNVETNFTIEQIVSLAWFANKKINASAIETHVLATSFAYGRLVESWTNSFSYLILNQKKRAELICEIWGIEVSVDPTDSIYPPLPGDEESEEEEEEPPLVPREGEDAPGEENSEPSEEGAEENNNSGSEEDEGEDIDEPEDGESNGNENDAEPGEDESGTDE